MDKAFEYIKATGVDKESTYPYVGSDETCQATVENKTDGLPVGIRDMAPFVCNCARTMFLGYPYCAS